MTEPESTEAPPPAKPVERLFPFTRKSGVLVVGRDSLYRLRRKLHFLLLTTDLSAGSRQRFENDFTDVPIVSAYTSSELEKHFNLFGTKILGFKKSPLATSIFRELRDSGKFPVRMPVPGPVTHPPMDQSELPDPDQAGTDSDISAV